jgi:hypothetical protein
MISSVTLAGKVRAMKAEERAEDQLFARVSKPRLED